MSTELKEPWSVYFVKREENNENFIFYVQIEWSIWPENDQKKIRQEKSAVKITWVHQEQILMMNIWFGIFAIQTS